MLLPVLKKCLERILTECLNLDKTHHFSSLLHVIYRIGLFKDVTFNNAHIRSKFSTLCSITLFDLLNVDIFELKVEKVNQNLNECIEIAESPIHPFKRLSIVGIEKLVQFAMRHDENLLFKIVEWKLNKCSSTTLYPHYAEFQNIVQHDTRKETIEPMLKFYSSLYSRLCYSDELIDVLLIFTSAIIEKAHSARNNNVLKAYEYCLDRLLFLSKSVSSSIVKSYSDQFLTIPNEAADWDKIIGTMSEIKNPVSFSEWIFCITLSSCSFSKSHDGDLIRSFLPALIDPFSLIPILPIFIVTAYHSSGKLYLNEYFKPTFLRFIEIDCNSTDGITLTLDILNEVFSVFSSENDVSGTDNGDIPTWLNLFTVIELLAIYRRCIKRNILKYTDFFMQLIWSIDSKKVSNDILFDTFTKSEDYISALCVGSNENYYGIDRTLYYFMSTQQNSLAEATMNSMNVGKSEVFSSICIKNSALKMDKDLFSYNYERISRLSPDLLHNFSNVKSAIQAADYFNFGNFCVDSSIKYECENSAIAINAASELGLKRILPWDNFRLLHEAKIFRKNRNFENAYHLITRMKTENDSFWTLKQFLELGNWFHSSGKFSVSIEIFQSLVKEQKNPKLLAKIYRKLAVSMVSSRHFSDQEIIDVFEKSSNLDKSCAKVSFEIGSFYDSKLQSSTDRTALILKNYARALLNSRKYDHLTYPRFITIWLNVPLNSVSDKKVNELISRFVHVSSTAQAVGHLSQLISRVGHPKPADASLVEQLLMKIFADYADITLWKMGSVAHSSNEIRKSRIVTMLEKATPSIKNFDIKGFLEFCRLMITICDLAAPVDVFKISLSKEIRTCKRIMSNDILIAAPNSVLVYSPENKEGYDYIRGFEDHCIALPSLQRPKKIRFILNNSKVMTALLKPKDDLRKDCRFMELCRFLNLTFIKLKQKYEIKIYAVTPLNDECGIIEWVEYTASFRGILLKFYKRLGVSIAIRDLKDILAMQISPYEKFVKFFLPKFQPIFMRWFFEKFPSVLKWKAAINVYSNSLAVMSMVGFIIGLGDRHGENILFDETTGGCVHVDFNCLFEKGKTLEFPEKVPFRLTQNLEHACGAGGIHSAFKTSSSSIMNILWDSKRSILTNLETFLHDPLVEWSKTKKSNQTSDITNEQASKILKIVERKLNGYIDLENFSCDGQVEKLIQHAVDKKNLSEMYIGWSSFL